MHDKIITSLSGIKEGKRVDDPTIVSTFKQSTYKQDIMSKLSNTSHPISTQV